MTTYPKQLMMKEVKQKIEEAGVEVYDPASQPFNNKTEVGNEDIARVIVAKDTEAIYNSDIRRMNTQEDNLGTSIEAGIIKGYRDHAEVIYQVIEQTAGVLESEKILELIMEICEHEITKEYVPYHTDIRIHNEAEAGFRRSVGFHQFQRGENLLMGGYFSLNEAMDYIKNIQDNGYPNKGKESPIHVTVEQNGRIDTVVKGL